MFISIGEYLGQRTDIAHHEIIPQELGGPGEFLCPFSGLRCRKLNATYPKQPICSVRIYDQRYNGQPIDVCPDRLFPKDINGFWVPNIAMLASVGQVVFPGANSSDIGYRRQVSITFAKGRRLVLDYVLQVSPDAKYETGRKKVILEVQGGGETNATGAITTHITQWASLANPTNEILAKPLNAEYLRELLRVPIKTAVNVPGIIPNNAWKRQLDQVLKKAVLTQKFGGALALVMGEVLYDYVQGTLVAGRQYFPDWEIAILGISETKTNNSEAILFNKVSKAVFMTYADFIAALQDFSLANNVESPFNGEFTTLRNKKFRV